MPRPKKESKKSAVAPAHKPAPAKSKLKLGAKSESKLETRARASAPKAAAKPAPSKPAKEMPREPKPALPTSSPKTHKSGPAKVPAGKLMAPKQPDWSAATTEELWEAYRKVVTRSQGSDSGDLTQLRNQLMERHLPLVKYIAERLLQTLPKSIELDDLVSAGMFGLMDAIRGFDQSRGIKFKTYCSTRIRGAILDQLRSQDWVPRLVRLKATKIERAYQKLQGEFGREPTHAEMAAFLKMDHTELSSEIEEARAKTMYSLSEKWEDGDDDGSHEKVEVLEDRTAIDPVHELNRRDLMIFLTKALSDKERFIISMYYERGLTMREIGEILTLTESRVCQIHSNVMGRLRDQLEKREEGLIP